MFQFLKNSNNFRICCLCTNTQIVITPISDQEKSNIIYCKMCQTFQHIKCISPEQNMSNNYICYNCQLKVFDIFIVPILNIIPPIKTISSPFSDFEKTYQFLINGSQINSNQFLVLNISKLSESGFTFEYPKGLTLTLNNESLLTTNKFDHRIYQPIVFKTKEEANNKHYKKIKGVIYKFFKTTEGAKNILNIKLSKNQDNVFSYFLFSLN